MTEKKAQTKINLKSERLEIFARAFIIDWNATQAALEAGYSKKTAYSQGSRLLKNVEVRAMIDKFVAERAAKLEIDAEWVLRCLLDNREALISAIFDKETNAILPIHDWPKEFQQGLVMGIESNELFEGKGEDRQLVGYLRKVKFVDRLRVLQLIGQHNKIGAFGTNADGSVASTSADGAIRTDRLRATTIRPHDPAANDDKAA